MNGKLGSLLPWSLGAMRGDEQPGTPQWIVSSVRNVVQNLFWHFACAVNMNGEDRRRLGCQIHENLKGLMGYGA